MVGGMGKPKQKTLTRGALIFAFNNEQTDYLAMAEWSANNIRKHLGIPVDGLLLVGGDRLRLVTAADVGRQFHGPTLMS